MPGPSVWTTGVATSKVNVYVSPIRCEFGSNLGSGTNSDAVSCHDAHTTFSFHRAVKRTRRIGFHPVSLWFSRPAVLLRKRICLMTVSLHFITDDGDGWRKHKDNEANCHIDAVRAAMTANRFSTFAVYRTKVFSNFRCANRLAFRQWVSTFVSAVRRKHNQMRTTSPAWKLPFLGRQDGVRMPIQRST